MNKMLVAIFHDEADALHGLAGLRDLHAQGDVTLYASGVVARDRGGVLVPDPMNPRPDDRPAPGPGVGSLIGLLGGPAGVSQGAMAGTPVGVLHDFQAAGVGLDFVADVSRRLRPGRVALVAEIDEDHVLPVDAALEAAGATVFRRSRTDPLAAQLDHEREALKRELQALQAEAGLLAPDARHRLQQRIAATQDAFDDVVRHAERRVHDLAREAEAKSDVLKAQLQQVGPGGRAAVEGRLQHLHRGLHARGVQLGKAWALARDALVA